MRTDAIDVDIAGTRVRVVCDDPAGIAVLRSALADHLIDGAAPVGFALRVPAGTKKFHVLMDRSGFVLARVRTSQEGLAVLGSHLAGLIPPPPGTIRIPGTAFLRSDSTAALAVFPHFLRRPAVERRLDRASMRVVDRLAVDIGPDTTLAMSATPWPALSNLPAVVGHAPASTDPTPIETVVVTHLPHEDPSLADRVSFMAASTWPGPPIADRLAIAEGLAAKNLVTVPYADQGALYVALQR